MTLLLAAAALLLLLGSSLIIHAVIEADADEPHKGALPAAQPSAAPEERRAA